ncbi:hypothetical protein [Microbacterium sp. 3J1]|uniref:hypothetical protein n=1 Tax=Microbacterium sp. 3J1 TaxID=861269 RepID=UPI000B303758|nr:hypothetical protein [Microbacterium sp. 3J1]
MNDKNPTDGTIPTPDQTPANPTPPAPPAPPAATPASGPDAETVPVAPVHSDATTASSAPAAAADTTPAARGRRGRKRGLLIGGGIAAALVLAGGGVAVGAAIGDEFGDDDDRPSMSDGPRQDDDSDGQRGDDRDGDDDRQDAPRGGGPVSGIGTDSADEIIAIADAARGAAEGDVTSIDAKRDGTWEVQLASASGAESEVRVDSELAATVISTESDDDSAPALTLDDDTIRALVDAALAEADGMITDLDVDDDTSSPYDASVLTSDNRSIDIDFSADFAVIGTDSDD